VHQVDGYHIRAHYGQGKVDFTITKNSPKTRDLNWREIERVMFEKLNRVGFRVEPTQRPNSALRAFCDGGVGNILRFSVQTRNIPPRVAVSTTPGVGSSFAGHAGGLDFAKKGEETKIKLDLEERKPLQAGLELPEATLPQYLPDITSYQIDGKGGFQFQRITGPNTVSTRCLIPHPVHSQPGLTACPGFHSFLRDIAPSALPSDLCS
jgi:hypothetical protein